jgi:ribosomal protein S18 acetylase RimI-like enzyme
MSDIRQPTLPDTAGVYRVCFETADADPTMNPDLLGHVYAGPYLAQHPDLARVVADDHGISGYVLGCADTRAFEAWAEESWWPALREQYPLGGGDAVDAEMIGLLHAPPRSPDEVVEQFPAHLHIDLLPRTQGHGYGRTLIEWLCAELAARGIRGVHLGVGSDNPNAIAFYEHLGFVTALDDGDTRWMTRKL